MTRPPLREPTFLILTALASGSLHGYGVIQEVAALSGDRVRLRAGTLYGALDRLSEQGLVAADREEIVDGRLRRYYVLTDDGAAVLDAEAQRLVRNAEAAVSRLRGRAAARATRPPPKPKPARQPAGGDGRRTAARSDAGYGRQPWPST
jgi:DNA-binding PadR family transcriptional regulator